MISDLSTATFMTPLRLLPPRVGLPVYQRRARFQLWALSLGRVSTRYSARPSAAATYIQQAAAWVRSLPFNRLVAAIYRAYPDMKANSGASALGVGWSRMSGPPVRG
jgi:hypothetical protein